MRRAVEPLSFSWSWPRGGSEVAFEDGLGDPGTVPDGEELVGDRHERERVSAMFLDGGGQQAARYGTGVEDDPPLLRPEGQEFQPGQPGDFQRVGERAGQGGEGTQPGQAGGRGKAERL